MRFFNLATKQVNYFRVMWLVAEMEWWRCGTYSLNSVWRLSRSRKHPWILDQFFYKTCHLLELYTLMKAKYSLVPETMRYDVVVINQETFLACEINCLGNFTTMLLSFFLSLFKDYWNRGRWEDDNISAGTLLLPETFFLAESNNYFSTVDYFTIKLS